MKRNARNNNSKGGIVSLSFRLDDDNSQIVRDVKDGDTL